VALCDCNLLYLFRSFFQFVGDLAELKEKDYGTVQQPVSKRELFKPAAHEVTNQSINTKRRNLLLMVFVRTIING
jgi:hypothetical protein